MSQMRDRDDEPLDFLLARFAGTADAPALIWHGSESSYAELRERVDYWSQELERRHIQAGQVVAIEGDFSPNAVAVMVALFRRRAIAVPLAGLSQRRAEQLQIARAERSICISDDDHVSFETLTNDGRHALYERLRADAHPGLVLFTSGSSGQPKGAVHDVVPLFEKFREPRPALRTLNFLLFDHWGGLNTLFHALSNGAAVVTVDDRRPDRICALIEEFAVELLPASPSFLNLLLAGRAYERHDLSSLQVITYGTEPMPAHTLSRLAVLFPDVKLQQTYGLIELGVLRSRSRDRESLWVKVGGEGYETRVRDGLLEIRARSAMLGYLNAPSPFTEDGWFMTGDAVEVDDEWLRILGRRSELINVGGEKVYPVEVESAIEELENVVEARVYAEPNALLGNIVCAEVRLERPELTRAITARVKSHCAERLRPYMVPVKVTVVDQALITERFKRVRERA